MCLISNLKSISREQTICTAKWHILRMSLTKISLTLCFKSIKLKIQIEWFLVFFYFKNKIGSMHIFKGTQNVWLSLFAGYLAAGPGSVIPSAWTVLLEPIPYDGMSYSVLMQWKEAWSYFRLMCQAFWLPKRGLTLLGRWWGMKESYQKEGRRGNCGWYLKWIKKSNKKESWDI